MADNNDYIFASARIRGAEKSLLTRERAEKMADSKTPEEALKLLADLGYGVGETGSGGGAGVRSAAGVQSGAGAHATAAVQSGADAGGLSGTGGAGNSGSGGDRVDRMLARELVKTYDFVLGLVPDREILRPFLCPYEYHNLKVLLKAEFAETDGSAALIPIGEMPPEELSVLVRERNFSSMSPAMRDAVLEAIDVFSRTRDPQTIDFVLDRACYGEMASAAADTGNPFLQDYVRLTIDILNLKAFARIREMKRTADFFGNVFLPGGRVPEKLFSDSWEDSWETFSEKLLSYGLSDAAAQGGAAVRDTGRFTVLEKLCDDAVMDFARDAKYVSFGPEPMLAYLIAKEGDIRLARIILAGLSQGLSREQIAERMRKTYV